MPSDILEDIMAQIKTEDVEAATNSLSLGELDFLAFDSYPFQAESSSSRACRDSIFGRRSLHREYVHRRPVHLSGRRVGGSGERQ